MSEHLSMDVLANRSKTSDSLPKLDEEMDYERGFVDGMQYQMQKSVDKAVNAMARKWVGLTDAEIDKEFDSEGYTGVAFADGRTGIVLDRQAARDFARAIAAKLREKNT